MLTELESLSQNIGRLIEISQRHHEARLALEEQLAQSRAEAKPRAERTRAGARRTRRAASGTRRAVGEDRRRAGAPECDPRKTAACASAHASRTTSSICSSPLQHRRSKRGAMRRHPPRRKCMTTKQIEVSILGVPYRLACSPETEGALLEAVARVDAEMSKIRNAQQRARHGSHCGHGCAVAGIGTA